MKHIFLESHNIDNQNFGFGQFNFHLINSLSEIQSSEYKITLHTKKTKWLKSKFGDTFNYKKYYTFSRKPFFRIRKKYDLWHSLNQNTKIEPYHKIPYLLTIHNISYIEDKDNYKHLKNHVKFQEKINRSNAITYISNYAKESTHQYFNVPNIPEYVIHNGNPITKTFIEENFKPNYNPQKPFLFSIGQISERKNFISLVNMMEKISDFELIIAGKKSTNEAKKIISEIEKLNLKHKVKLIGEISELEKIYYYKHCEAFLFPSLREGFGLPVIEAMKFGKPVFISDNTSLPEIGGKVANYWKNYDPEYMRLIFEKGMNDYYNDRIVQENQLISQAEKFSWNNAALNYKNVYEKLLNL